MVLKMAQDVEPKAQKDWLARALIAGAVVGISLIAWQFPAIHAYLDQNLASKAIVPMEELGLADVARIVAASNADSDLFGKSFSGRHLSVDAVFVGVEGGAPYLIKTKTPDGTFISCAMNRFTFESKKDTIGGFKAGDGVRVSGSIERGAKGATVSLSNGCSVERSYSAKPAP